MLAAQAIGDIYYWGKGVAIDYPRAMAGTSAPGGLEQAVADAHDVLNLADVTKSRRAPLLFGSIPRKFTNAPYRGLQRRTVAHLRGFRE